MLSVDEHGKAILTNFPRRISIYHFTFKGAVTALSFSPSGQHFAVAIGRRVQVWQTPSVPGSDGTGELEFAPFILLRDYAGHFDTIQNIHWSGDSRFFLTASKDLTARVWSLVPLEGFEPTTLSGHREGVVNAWFTEDQEAIFTISKDGALFRWEFCNKDRDPEVLPDASDLRWRIVKKDFFMQHDAKVNCAAFHAKSSLLVVGFSNGLFTLYELPDFNQIHMLRYVILARTYLSFLY